MASKINLLANVQAAKDTAPKGKNTNAASDLADLMSDPNYLRQSSALINDALQKGFDVLQLANGDIVTTGTKTVVYTYSWNDDSKKLAKAKAGKRPRRAAAASPLEADLEDED